jgi:serine/threonine-protein kinase
MFQRAQDMEDDVQSLLAANDVKAAAERYHEADSCLALAVSLDKSWTRPVVVRGWVAYRQARLPGGFDRQAIPQWLAEATTYANQALAMQPRDANALELRGTVRYFSWLLNLEPDQAKADLLHQGAQQDLEAAVNINPDQAGAWNALSHMHLAASENALGKLAARKAYEADPFLTNADQIIWRLFSSSLDLEDKLESAHWCSEGSRRFPRAPRFIECQLWLATLPGVHPDIAGTWRLQAQMQELTPDNQKQLSLRKGRMLVALALARAGLADSARRVALSARAGADLDPVRDLTMIEAIMRTMIGDKDEAIRLLSVYLATNPQLREGMAKDDSWYFRDLNQESRYREIVGIR